MSEKATACRGYPDENALCTRCGRDEDAHPSGREATPSKIVSVLMHEEVKDALEARFGYRLRFDRAAEFDDGEVEAYMLVPSTLAPLTPPARPTSPDTTP